MKISRTNKTFFKKVITQEKLNKEIILKTFYDKKGEIVLLAVFFFFFSKKLYIFFLEWFINSSLKLSNN